MNFWEWTLKNLGLGKPWYEVIFGGKRAYQGVLCAGCGLVMWFTITNEIRKANIHLFLIFFAVCFGFYIMSDLKGKAIAMKNGKNARDAEDKGQ